MRFALSECILLATLQHHADFNCRVVTMIRLAPYNLFINAKRAKDIKCLERLDVCKEVLSTADEKLHVIARKLKFVYKDQLVFCADNCGACRLELWLLVVLSCRHTEYRRLLQHGHERNGPGSEHQVTVTERSMRQSLLLSWNFWAPTLTTSLFGEILRDEG